MSHSFRFNRFERGPYRRSGTFKVDRTLALFLERIKPIRPRIRELRVFGSRARGEERVDSDYDLFVALDRRDPDVVEALRDAAYDVLLDTGKIVSLTIFPKQEVDRLMAIPTPFMVDLMEEGISL